MKEWPHIDQILLNVRVPEGLKLFLTHRSGNYLFEKKYPPETVFIFETTIHRTII